METAADDISVQRDSVELEPGDARDGPGEDLKSSASEAGGSNAHEPDDGTWAAAHQGGHE